MLYKWIFKLGQTLRNPSLNRWFVFLKKSENWSLEELESYQLKKLKEVLNYAYDNYKYYKNRFDENQLNPKDISKLEDLKKYPITNKKDLLVNNQSINNQTNLRNTRKANTSGSTGESLQFYREESADSFNRASIFRGYSWYQINPWDVNGYFWGFNFSKIKRIKIGFLDLLQNRFRLFSYKDKEMQVFLKKLKKAKYLHGYSSMIYESARIINKNEKSGTFNLKLVKGTSEKIFDKYQEEVKKAFGVKMISEYGAAETGIIAFECPEGHMHINMEGVLVEVVDHEILVTNLQMKSFPIIRYKLGDYVKLADKDYICKCGLSHPIIEEVTGRVGENIYGNTEVYPSLYLYYIFKNLSEGYKVHLNYQVIQNQKGTLIFNVSQKLNKNEFDLLSNQIVKYFSNDIQYEISDGETFVIGKNKLKNFISNVDE